jgi:hypothetical protein
MLVVVWKVPKLFINQLIVFLCELEWSLLKVILGVSMIDEGTEFASLYLSNLNILSKSLEAVRLRKSG